MQEIEIEREVAAAPERVFEALTDHEGLVHWSDVREVVLRHPGDPHPNGVGAIRVIRARGVAVEEEILVYDPPKRMEWRVTAGLPLRDHHGVVVLEPGGEGTRLRWSVRFRARIPGTGALLRRIVRASLDRMLLQLDAHLRADPG